MSNSSRIEQATREHVGAVLTSEQIVELVKMSDPTSTKGVYPSDVAYKRVDGVLVPRGKQAYGDGILEFLAENSYKVLATADIVRRPTSKKTPTMTPSAPVASPAPAPADTKSAAKKTDKKKAVTSASQPPSAAKSKAISKGSVQ